MMPAKVVARGHEDVPDPHAREGAWRIGNGGGDASRAASDPVGTPDACPPAPGGAAKAENVHRLAIACIGA